MDNELIKICPICGSTSLQQFNWGQWISLGKEKMECVNCRHTDFFFPQIEKSKVEDFRKRIKK